MTIRRTVRSLVERLRKSRIGLRVFAFNLLVLFLPVAGILYLDLYEDRLLQTQERGMVEQARLAAAALGAAPSLTASDARSFLIRLREQGDSRIRIFDPEGRVLADSRSLSRNSAEPGYSEPATRTIRDRLLYRLGVWLVGVKRAAGALWDRTVGFDSSVLDGARDPDDGLLPEVGRALQGRYGAATRPTASQRSMTLHSAVPIKHGDTVIGAVVVSQSTYRILQALYSLRLRIFEVVVASAIVAALLSALMSATIVRPLVRLRNAASSLAERRTPLSGTFKVVDHEDEIGDLARALDELAQRLDAHIRLLESFAADVSHEFKNPLASIRTASEMLVAADDPQDRERFLAMLTKDVDRLEHLVSGVQELARIDAQLASEPAAKVDAAALISEIARNMSGSGATVSLTVDTGARHLVRASRDRLTQVFENILENARSFAPHAGIEITVLRDADRCRVTVADSGPGIHPAHLERIFERFFTYRPSDPHSRRQHSGLGLAIARTIVEGYGGTIEAENRAEGGARFIVELPAAE